MCNRNLLPVVKVRRDSRWPAQAIRDLEREIADACSMVSKKHGIKIDQIHVTHREPYSYEVHIDYLYNLGTDPPPPAKEPSFAKSLSKTPRKPATDR